ncbi:hypothetical protein ACTNDY_07095 [Tissierellaceae bacterium HCP3S3_D8]
MKKFITVLTLSLLLATFSTGFVHAEAQVLPQEVDEVLNELERMSDNIVDTNNLKLEEAMEEVLELKDDIPAKVERLEGLYHRVQDGAKAIAEIVERQYDGKKQFVLNTKEVYELSVQLQEDLSDLRLEMKDLIKDKDREIDKETYGEIRNTTNTLKQEIKENDYIVGEIAKEVKTYLRLVKDKKFRDAVRSFERILILQDQQIELLKIIDRNILELNDILLNA